MGVYNRNVDAAKSAISGSNLETALAEAFQAYAANSTGTKLPFLREVEAMISDMAGSSRGRSSGSNSEKSEFKSQWGRGNMWTKLEGENYDRACDILEREGETWLLEQFQALGFGWARFYNVVGSGSNLKARFDLYTAGSSNVISGSPKIDVLIDGTDWDEVRFSGTPKSNGFEK